MARPGGFEPPTLGLENRCSIENPLITHIHHKIIQQSDQDLTCVATYERQEVYLKTDSLFITPGRTQVC